MPDQHRVDPSPSSTAPAAARSLLPALGMALSVLAAAFGWLMCTLAAGAVAAFIGILTGVRPCWWILVLAVPLALALKFCGSLYVRWAGPVAAAAIVLASFYAVCLVAVARIAGTLGFPFGQAFRIGGPGLTLQVAKLGLGVTSILVFAAAAVLAAIVAVRVARPAARR